MTTAAQEAGGGVAPQPSTGRRGDVISLIAGAWQIVAANIDRRLAQRDARRIRLKLDEARRLLSGERVACEPRMTAGEREALRRRVFEAYGGACACCGESHERVLTIDHIEPLRGRKRGGDIYRQLIAAGFPRDGHQVLCLNCNALKGDGAACAHITEARRLLGLAA